MSGVILVTGSAGHLGEALVRTLRAAGRPVRGVDLIASPWTDVVGSIIRVNTSAEDSTRCSTVMATLNSTHTST